jgi:hypothetical protein
VSERNFFAELRPRNVYQVIRNYSGDPRFAALGRTLNLLVPQSADGKL